MAFRYSRDRGGEHLRQVLTDDADILQTDAYAGSKNLFEPGELKSKGGGAMKFQVGDRVETSDENGVVRGTVLGPLNTNDQGGALWTVRLDDHDGSAVSVLEKLMRRLD